MDKQKIIIIVIALLLLASIIGAAVYLLNSQTSPENEITGTQTTTKTDSSSNPSDSTTTVRSAPELNEVISEQKPELVVNGQPIYDVIDTKRVDEVWYIVKIKNTVDATVGNAWVILKDQGEAGGGLVVVAGPGTYFSSAVPIPETVRKAIK